MTRFSSPTLTAAAHPGMAAGPTLALSILARFPGAAVELSHSGQGLHIFGRAAPMAHGKRNAALNLELYTEGRFCALTGTGALGDASTEARRRARPVHRRVLPADGHRRPTRRAGRPSRARVERPDRR